MSYTHRNPILMVKVVKLSKAGVMGRRCANLKPKIPSPSLTSETPGSVFQQFREGVLFTQNTLSLCKMACRFFFSPSMRRRCADLKPKIPSPSLTSKTLSAMFLQFKGSILFTQDFCVMGKRYPNPLLESWPSI